MPVSIVMQARTSVACQEEEEEGAQPSESAEFMRGGRGADVEIG